MIIQIPQKSADERKIVNKAQALEVLRGYANSGDLMSIHVSIFDFDDYLEREITEDEWDRLKRLGWQSYINTRDINEIINTGIRMALQETGLEP